MTIDVPAPRWTADSAPFWAALRDHELRIPYCTACERWFFPPMPGCPQCGADPDRVEFRPVSGYGRVHSWFVAHHAFHPAFEAETPYTVLDVTLDEGPRINARLLGTPADQIRPDLRVVAAFEDLPGFTRLAFTAHHLTEEGS